MAGNRQSVSLAFSGNGQETSELVLNKDERYAISVDLGGGTFTVSLYRNVGLGYRKVKDYTANTEEDGIAPCNCTLKLQTTAHTSGTGTSGISK